MQLDKKDGAPQAWAVQMAEDVYREVLGGYCDEVFVTEGYGFYDDVTQRFARALQSTRAAALEEAAQEAASWWGLFDFKSFDDSDPRRAANPNQIAERIRWLKTQEVAK